MRILHVDKFHRRQGGAAGYMLDVAELQRQAGHTVEFFAMAHPDNLDASYAAHFPSRVELDPPPTGVRERVVTTARMLWSTSAARGMAATADAFRPDVVHLHNVYHQLSPSILRPLRQRRVPVVMTVHDYKLVCPTYRLLDHGQVCEDCVGAGPLLGAPLRRRCKDGSLAASAVLAFESGVHRALGAWAGIDRFIAPSAFLAGILRRGGFDPDKVVHLPNFVDAGGLAPRADPGEGFAYVGRLSEEKGVDTLITAIGSIPGATLTVAGDGPEREALETRAGAVASGQVRFLGQVDRTTLAELNRSVRAAALPARWHENMPLSVLETMAAGTPVVVSGLGGLPELVEDGVNGRVVPHDDPAALAEALTELGTSPTLARRMGGAARRRALERHDPARHLDQLEVIYDEIRAVRSVAATRDG